MSIGVETYCKKKKGDVILYSPNSTSCFQARQTPCASIDYPASGTQTEIGSTYKEDTCFLMLSKSRN